MKPIIAATLLSFSLLFSLTVRAGQACEENKAPQPQIVEKASIAAGHVEHMLEDKKVHVAIIARIGQDLSKYNLKYSHLALVYKSADNEGWVVLHELNTCGTAESALYIQGLGNFFLDDLLSYDSRIFVPSAELQENIYNKVILKPDFYKRFHSPNYNMLAHPFNIKYQNSNQFVLELLAASMSKDLDIQNRNEAQAWLQFSGFQPTTLQLGTGVRLGARLSKANISFDDQPFDKRMNGHIDTVSVDSLFNFISQKDKLGYFLDITSE